MSPRLPRSLVATPSWSDRAHVAAIFHVRAVIALCLLAYAGLTFADGPPCGRPHGPPPEAVAACVNQAEGARVSFKGRDGQAVAATCRKMGDVLAAWPDRMTGKGGPGGPGDHGDRPPPPPDGQGGSSCPRN